MRYPEFLQDNGTIGFVAPSFGCATEPYYTAFQNALKNFHDMGFKTEIGPNCLVEQGVGISNKPEICGAELNEAYVDEVSDILWKRTDYTWPCTWFTPRVTGEGAFKSAYDVMNNWGANHGAISYGHIGADLITLCSILRIPVCMHNVPEEDIFRPAAWNAFGMDKEGADYRACANYGAQFKK